ncbi:MAG: flagellar hook-basal body complex protein FliE [Gemmataceae bacterium]
MGIQPISWPPSGAAGVSQAETSRPSPALPFEKIVHQLIEHAQAYHAQSEEAIKQLVTGQTDNIHNVLLTIAQADLSLRLLVEVRNKLTEAYQEIMRMQV